MAPALGLLLAGLVLTFVAVHLSRQALRAEAQARFDEQAQRLESEVRGRILQPAMGLKGARGAYAVTGRLNRLQFREYVDSCNLLTEFPGIRGFGFVQRVMREDLARFEQAERLDHAPDFSVKTSGSAADLYVIKYVEPLHRNRPAWGMDIGAEQARREAAERAVATGDVALSGPVVLAQDEQHGAGWLLFVPVYRAGTELLSPEGRLRNLEGLLYAPIVAAEVLGPTRQAVDSLVDFRLYDGAAAAGDAGLLFDTRAQTPADGYEQRMFQARRPLVIGGHAFSLHIASAPALESAARSLMPLVIGVLGGTLSLLLALSAWLLMSARARAVDQARGMTADLERMANVLERTSNAVFGVGRDRRISWINQGFTRLTGYSEPEALGRTVDDLLGHPKAEAAARRALQQAAAAGEGCRVEILNRRKDGSDYWVETEIQPTRDAAGQVNGFIEIALDITARKQAQQRLSASEAFLEQAARIAHVGGWAVDVETGSLVISQEMYRIFGLSQGAQPGIGDFLGFFDTPARELIGQTAQDCIKTGRPWDLELPATTPYGRSLWVRSVGQVERRGNRSVRLVGTVQDVTERRAMEEELRLNNARMQAVLHNLPCGLSVFDGELRLVAHNTTFRTLLDFPDELFAGREVRFVDILEFNGRRGEYGEADVLATIRQLVLQAPTPEAYRMERRRPNGQHLEVRGAPMPGGGFVTTYVDVTDRKRAEQALRASEHMMRVVTDNIPGRVAYWDRDLRCKFVNRVYCEAFGKPMEQLLGRTVIEIFGPARYATRRERIEKALAGEAQHFERSEHDAQGNEVTTLIHYMPDIQGGEVRGFFVLALDVTELRQARDLALQGSMAKSQFLANMSHEIRTPMNAILGMLALLQSTALTTRQRDYAAKTEGAARSLLGLLNDILDFSKVEAGKMTLDPRPFGFDTLLRDLSVILSANIGSKDIEVLFDVDPAVPALLLGDDMRLRQVLINLGGNAIKFTNQGEVLVQVRVTRRAADGVTLAISVRDTGIGIAPRYQARIFSGFSQAEASTTRRFGGTGLGLAISQRLVGLMGGELKLESAAGQGSCFHFELTLPIAEQAPPAGDVGAAPATSDPAPTATASAARALSIRRVLIVDDNPVAREVLGAMARTLGWTADLAGGGEQALSLLTAARKPDTGGYDAIFVDWRMPGMDGWELSRRIRALPSLGSAPLLVMVTAHGRETLARRGRGEQGLLDGFLVKPVTASMLLDAVAEALGMAPGAGAADSPGAAAPGEPARGSRRLAGLRLLVVEDNANNQQVVLELLAAQGAQVDLAGDGRVGVDRVATAQPPYDAVLMDLQMPVMDGYAATREIRRTPGMARLPVIAMTANAMASDRDKCLAAGMNDHIGKPFDLEELVQALLRHTGRAGPKASGGAAGHAARPEPAEGAFAGGADDIQLALDRLGGDAGLFMRLVPSFLADIQSMGGQLGELLEKGERIEAGRLLHTLKGLAGTMGAARLAEAARQAEAVVEKAAGPADQAMLAAMHEALRQAGEDMARLRERLAFQPVGQQPAAAIRDLRSMIQELLQMLDTADMQAIEAYEQLRRAHGPALGAYLAPLDGAVEALDFQQAAALCRALLVQPSAA